MPWNRLKILLCCIALSVACLYFVPYSVFSAMMNAYSKIVGSTVANDDVFVMWDSSEDEGRGKTKDITASELANIPQLTNKFATKSYVDSHIPPGVTNPLVLGNSHLREDSGTFKILNSTESGFLPLQASDFLTGRSDSSAGYWLGYELLSYGPRAHYIKMKVPDEIPNSQTWNLSATLPNEGDVLIFDGGTGSDPKVYNWAPISADSTISVRVTELAVALTGGNGKNYYVVPEQLDGYSIVGVGGHVFTASGVGQGKPTIDVKVDGVSCLSTLLTIDEGEKDSKDASVPAVINTSFNQVLVGSEIRFDITVPGNAIGLEVRLRMRKQQ